MITFSNHAGSALMRNMFRPTRWIVAALAALTLTVTGCSSIGSSPQPSSAPASGVPKAGGTLVVALSAEPDALDPSTGRTLVGRSIFTAICEKLYDINDKLEIVPQLAAALPEVSADGLTVTIKLRPGVKFADGTPLDATAVKTSLDRHRTLATSARKSELSSVANVAVTD